MITTTKKPQNIMPNVDVGNALQQAINTVPNAAPAPAQAPLPLFKLPPAPQANAITPPAPEMSLGAINAQNPINQARPTFPEVLNMPKVTKTNPDKSVTAQLGGQNFTLSEKEWSDLISYKQGRPTMGPLTANQRLYLDFEKSLNAIEAEARGQLPPGIDNSKQFELYNDLKQMFNEKDFNAKAPAIIELVKRATSQPVTPFEPGAGGLAQKAGFAASGISGGVGLAGLSAAATGGVALPAIAAGVAGGVVANIIKSDATNLKEATNIATGSATTMEKLITYANAGLLPQDQLIEAFEKQRRDIYAVEAYLSRESWKYKFWIDRGKPQLQKIKEWKDGREQAQIARFYQAIMKPDKSQVNYSFLESTENNQEVNPPQ